MSTIAQIAPSVMQLQETMRNMPQVELPTFHFFADGMYARVVPRAAGVTIVGKVHKREHFYIVTKGRVLVVDDAGRHEYQAGDVIVSRPGTKRAVHALEDSICMTVHRTDETDLEKIEAEIIEPDEAALFDAHNKLKPKELECLGSQ